MIDEQHAVQMVHLMLEAGREETGDLFLHNLAVEIEPSGPNPIRAIDLGIRASTRSKTEG